MKVLNALLLFFVTQWSLLSSSIAVAATTTYDNNNDNYNSKNYLLLSKVSKVNEEVRQVLLASIASKSNDSKKKYLDGYYEEIGSGPNGGRLLAPKKKKKKDDEKEKLNKKQKKHIPDSTNACTKLVAEEQTWKTWKFDVTTFTPVFRPKTDNELKDIITSSIKNGCTIRMMGSRHSSDGLVMQRTETGVVVISLASHITSVEGWDDSINTQDATFRIGAGKSWYDVSALIRPHGFVLFSRTSSAFFSVGGVISNMAHGGGRDVGFVHDDVTKMLVLTSNGEFQVIDSDDELKFWRNSLGQLGMIVAIEMNIRSESIPFVAGIDPNTGQVILDKEKGGLRMTRETTFFEQPTDAISTIGLITNIVKKAYETAATYDSSQFFFNGYTSSLAEYRTDFSGPSFSGGTGPFADPEKEARYAAATNDIANADINADAAFTGGVLLQLSKDLVCELFCIPPSGPEGDGSPCIGFPSSLVPEKLLCEVPIEVSAAISTTVIDVFDSAWDSAAAGQNDGFSPLDVIVDFDSVAFFVPTRSLGSIIGAFYGLFAQAVSSTLPGINYFPNSILEFRFINPKETATLNPIPTLKETEIAFNEKYAPFFGPDAFNNLLPPPPPGVPDGYTAIELLNIRDLFDEDYSKFFLSLQRTCSSMPTNPFVPYGDNVVKECNAVLEIFPCGDSSPLPGTTCCNPPIPAYGIHLGKGWGYDFDAETTPVTEDFVPFQDSEIVNSIYTTGSKKDSVAKFNEKVQELKADVFSGGATLRWLQPSAPDSGFEPRKLNGQICGALKFQNDPDAECINNNCLDDICT